MLVTKEVEVTLNKSNISHYESLGYEIPRIMDKYGNSIVSNKTKIKVNVIDLQPSSGIYVSVQCDYDGRIVEKKYVDYLTQRKNIQKDCCNNVNCMKKKREESNIKVHGVKNSIDICGVKDKIKQTNLEKYGCEYAIGSVEVREKIKQSFVDRYGVNNPFQIEDVKNKIKQTCLDRYGVEHYNKTEESKQRYKETCLEKYGYDNASKFPEIIEKIKEIQFEKYGSFYSQTSEYKERVKATNLEKYGVENLFQSDEVKQRIIEFNLETYGEEHPMKVESIKQDRIRKMIITKYRNGTMQTSRQQEYLYLLYGGELNYPVDKCSLDIAFPSEMIFCEYDGSGHDLSVQFGDTEKEDFDKREMQRKYFLNSLGWREIRIISLEDYLPTNEVLLHMYDFSVEYFKSGHSWIKFDIDNNKIITSQNIQDFNYGKLRKIKEEDLEEVS